MTKQSSPFLGIPSSTLVAAVVAAMSFFALNKLSFVDTRPRQPPVPIYWHSPDNMQDIEARLWEDPLAAVSRARAADPDHKMDPHHHADKVLSTMRRGPRMAHLTLASMAILAATRATHAAEPSWTPLGQGGSWTEETRADFYHRDQGSRLIPLRWIAALKQADGESFMADSLTRYGYLMDEGSTPPGLPVGFTVANTTDGEYLGMTCAACHTREVTVLGKPYRVDGGPAFADLQSLLTDLDAAVTHLLVNTVDFDAFCNSVLGASPTREEKDSLRRAVTDWHTPFHAIVSLGTPDSPWGPGRLDAISMIFNRLTGLDIGTPPTFIIDGNIKRADAPARYPFLWNASRQDRTQWPGFADNGNSILALSRNVGEVTGVFAAYHPTTDHGRLLGVNFIGTNSSNFDGLITLETLVRKIGPPQWIWPVNATLAKQGSGIFARECSQGCHEVKPGLLRSLNPAESTWATPVQNVGTDTREWSILQRRVDPGILTGISILGLTAPLRNPELPLNVLQLSVLGSIIQHKFPVVLPDDFRQRLAVAGTVLTPKTESLKGAFPHGIPTASPGSYETRVLRGIWAAAPYLHNGSVPSLSELLKPAAERVASFKIGPTYDLEAIGLAAEQGASAPLRQTTDCRAIDSGNSRCGHEFGVRLPPAQKAALLEYLKTL